MGAVLLRSGLQTRNGDQSLPVSGTSLYSSHFICYRYEYEQRTRGSSSDDLVSAARGALRFWLLWQSRPHFPVEVIMLHVLSRPRAHSSTEGGYCRQDFKCHEDHGTWSHKFQAPFRTYSTSVEVHLSPNQYVAKSEESQHVSQVDNSRRGLRLNPILSNDFERPIKRRRESRCL